MGEVKLARSSGRLGEEDIPERREPPVFRTKKNLICDFNLESAVDCVWRWGFQKGPSKPCEDILNFISREAGSH